MSEFDFKYASNSVISLLISSSSRASPRAFRFGSSFNGSLLTSGYFLGRVGFSFGTFSSIDFKEAAGADADKETSAAALTGLGFVGFIVNLGLMVAAKGCARFDSNCYDLSRESSNGAVTWLSCVCNIVLDKAEL